MISGARQYTQRDFALSLTKARVALVTNAFRQVWGRILSIRFVLTNKLSKDDKLLLALDAFILSKSLRREISIGKIK
jgi:hypothetical protein